MRSSDRLLCADESLFGAADSPPRSTESIEFAGRWGGCPIEREVCDIVPTGLCACVVAAARVQLICSDRFGLFDVPLKVLMLNGCWRNMVVASSNEQERGTIIVGKVICGGCVRCEIGESTLK
jgi:hypothetical protein